MQNLQLMLYQILKTAFQSNPDQMPDLKQIFQQRMKLKRVLA